MSKLSALYLASAFLLAGCVVNPVTGSQQFTALVTPQQETATGAQAHPEILKQYGGAYRDSELQSYINAIGQRLAENAGRPDIRFTFTILDTPDVNAFALPGGYVYVTRGLLALANDESEIAAVIGHEIGHVTGRHYADQHSRAMVVGLGAALLGAAVDNPDIADLANTGANLYIKSYSRQQEFQADQLGVRYTAQNGWDPTAMARSLAQIDRHETLMNRLNGGGGADIMSSFFASHPNTPDRVRQAYALAQQAPKGDAVQAKADWLAAIDGLMFGDSPSQGFVRGDSFIHPELGIAFDAPGWRLRNSQTAVVGTGQCGKLVFDNDSPEYRGDIASYIANDWFNGKNIGRIQRFSVNGAPAATASLQATANGRPVMLHVVAIAWDENLIYRFMLIDERRCGAGALQDVVESMRTPTSREARSITPLRIRVVTARSGDSIRSFTQQMANDEDPEGWFRTINGLNPQDNIVAGQPYKIIADR